MPARLIVLAITSALVAVVAGCGQAQPGADVANSSQSQLAVQAHPQVVEPVAGATPAPARSHQAAASPAPSTSTGVLPQPVSLNEVRQQLARSGISANPGVATLTPSGLAVAPVGAPPQVEQIINAGNQIALLGYFYGGGHGTFEDSRYDCSGSVSFVLAAAHLLSTTETSGQFETYGAPGRGKWITIFANAGHMYMYVAGLRFDTVALAQGGSRWSNRTGTEGGGFVQRHPAGL
ncbi:MAG: hypothetical protein M3065_17625 [Actinomycetota bacterium]|nr:hypothetical protein [Actinomycetota bacterium]